LHRLEKLKMKNIKSLVLLFIVVSAFVGCSDDDYNIKTAEEYIAEENELLNRFYEEVIEVYASDSGRYEVMRMPIYEMIDGVKTTKVLRDSLMLADLTLVRYGVASKDTIAMKKNIEYLPRLDYFAKLALDTVDLRKESGLLMLHIKDTDWDAKEELGDSIGINKVVGTRYSLYKVADSKGETYLKYAETNKSDVTPSVSHTFDPNVGSSSSKFSSGMNMALQHMRLYGRAIIILPSTISVSKNYETFYYDVKITYLEK